MQRRYYSISNLPSLALPLAGFQIGNAFSQLQQGLYVTIGTEGLGKISMPLNYSNPVPQVFYLQALNLSGGSPFASSNLQSVTLTP